MRDHLGLHPCIPSGPRRGARAGVRANDAPKVVSTLPRAQSWHVPCPSQVLKGCATYMQCYHGAGRSYPCHHHRAAPHPALVPRAAPGARRAAHPILWRPAAWQPRHPRRHIRQGAGAQLGFNRLLLGAWGAVDWQSLGLMPRQQGCSECVQRQCKGNASIVRR